MDTCTFLKWLRCGKRWPAGIIPRHIPILQGMSINSKRWEEEEGEKRCDMDTSTLLKQLRCGECWPAGIIPQPYPYPSRTSANSNFEAEEAKGRRKSRGSCIDINSQWSVSSWASSQESCNRDTLIKLKKRNQNGNLNSSLAWQLRAL